MRTLPPILLGQLAKGDDMAAQWTLPTFQQVGATDELPTFQQMSPFQAELERRRRMALTQGQQAAQQPPTPGAAGPQLPLPQRAAWQPTDTPPTVMGGGQDRVAPRFPIPAGPNYPGLAEQGPQHFPAQSRLGREAVELGARGMAEDALRQKYAPAPYSPSVAKVDDDIRQAEYSADVQEKVAPWIAAAKGPIGEMGTTPPRMGGYAPGASDVRGGTFRPGPNMVIPPAGPAEKPYEYGMTQEQAQARAGQREEMRAGGFLPELTTGDQDKFATYMQRQKDRQTEGLLPMAERQTMVRANAQNRADVRGARRGRVPWEDVRQPMTDAEARYAVTPSEENFLAANPQAAPWKYQAEAMGGRMDMAEENNYRTAVTRILQRSDLTPEQQKTAIEAIPKPSRMAGGGGTAGPTYPPGSPMAKMAAWTPEHQKEYLTAQAKGDAATMRRIAGLYEGAEGGTESDLPTALPEEKPSMLNPSNWSPWGQAAGAAGATYLAPTMFAKAFPPVARAVGQGVGGLLGTNWPGAIAKRTAAAVTQGVKAAVGKGVKTATGATMSGAKGVWGLPKYTPTPRVQPPPLPTSLGGRLGTVVKGLRFLGKYAGPPALAAAITEPIARLGANAIEQGVAEPAEEAAWMAGKPSARARMAAQMGMSLGEYGEWAQMPQEAKNWLREQAFYRKTTEGELLKELMREKPGHITFDRR